MNWHGVSAAVLVVVLVGAAVSDLRRGCVYNWLTYPAVIVGLALGAAEGAGAGGAWDGFTNHAEGCVFGFSVLLAAYLFGGMGGGDVKLMAAIGALIGWPATLHAVFYSFLAAAAIGLIVVIWRGQTVQVLRRFWMAVRILPLPSATMDDAVPTSSFRVPFGFAACLGTLWFLGERWFGGSLWDVLAGRM